MPEAFLDFNSIVNTLGFEAVNWTKTVNKPLYLGPPGLIHKSLSFMK